MDLRTFVAESRRLKLQVACIDLRGAAQLTRSGWTIFSELPSLTRLYLNHSGVDAQVLRELVKQKRLQVLELDNSRLTDADLVLLRQLPELRALSLSRAKITDAGARTLGSLRQLQSLRLEQVRGLTAAGLFALQGLPRLTALDLFGWKLGQQLGDRAAEALSGFKHLRSLEIGSNAPEGTISSQVIARLGALQGLEELRLQFTSLTLEALKTVAGLRSLRKLDLSHVSGLDDLNLVYLDALASLRELRLRDAGVSLRGLGKLRKLRPRLELLNVEGLDVTEKAVRKLFTHPRLRVLAGPLG